MEAEHVRYEVDEGVAVITLDRPQAANAQSRKVLEELDHAWNEADLDRDVRVIVLRSNGKHFSAGHDMTGTDDDQGEVEEIFASPEGHYDWETRHYLHYAKAWREVPKPPIAEDQAKCIDDGLMLFLPCDLYIAA